MRHYNFGTGKWVFIDWLGIEPGYGTHGTASAESFGYCVPFGVELKTHAPEVLPEFCIAFDQPWEKNTISGYATFLEDNGIFRCWYEYTNNNNQLGYAESDDGINWRKPNLGLKDFNGSTENNMLNFGAHGAGVFIDQAATPEERYKMACCVWKEDEKLVMGATSPDGFSWTPLPEPLLRNHADTQNICCYDQETGKYVLYTRQTDGFMQRRGINRCESDNFYTFSPSLPVLESTPLDPPDWDYYCNGYARWPDAPAAHLMLMSMYKHTPDIVDIHLAVSRDGLIWNRPQGRQPLITSDQPHTKNYPTIYAWSGILQTGPGEWSVYLGATPNSHNQPIENMEQTAGILRARLREDGFMSLSSEGRGEVWTIPFNLECDTITLNAKTQHSGFIRAELLLSSGATTGGSRTENEAVAGYSLEECIPISGDQIDAPLTWKDGPELAKFKGQTVRLHLQMYKADLYSVKFKQHEK